MYGEKTSCPDTKEEAIIVPLLRQEGCKIMKNARKIYTPQGRAPDLGGGPAMNQLEIRSWSDKAVQWTFGPASCASSSEV